MQKHLFDCNEVAMSASAGQEPNKHEPTNGAKTGRSNTSSPYARLAPQACFEWEIIDITEDVEEFELL